MILSVLYALLALLLVTAVASATSVHLERKRLLTLADSAALAGATAVDPDAYYARTGQDSAEVVLTDASVRRAVEEHLEAAEGAGLADLTLHSAGTPDGRTAQVTLTALARPPLLTWVTAAWSDGIHLQVTTRARAG